MRTVLLLTLLAVLAHLSPCAAGQEETGADADQLENVVKQLEKAGRYAEAIGTAVRVLKIRGRISGEDSAPFAEAQSNLGRLYYWINWYDEAEPLFRAAVAIQKELAGPDNLEYATTLIYLGMTYYDLGLLDSAEQPLRDALNIRAHKLDHNDPAYATSLNNLALVYSAMDQYDRAEPLFKEALNIDRSLAPTSDSAYVIHLRNLADMYFSQSRFSMVEPLIEKVIEIDKRFVATPGRLADRETANQYILDLDTLGLTAFYLGHNREAKSTFFLARDACKTRPLETHYQCAEIFTHLGLLYQSAGYVPDALRALTEALEGEQDDINRGIYGLKAYIDSVQFSLRALVSVAAESHNDAAAELAFDWTVRRKALDLDAQILITRVKPWYDDDLGDKELNDRIRKLSEKIRKLTLSPPTGIDPDQQRRELAVSRASLERLHDDLDYRFSGAINWRSSKISLDAMRQQLPAGSALIEFFVVPEFNFKVKGDVPHWTPPRYVAFVLSSLPNAKLQFVDLGDAKEIDRQIAEVRDNIAGFKGLVSEKEGETEYRRLSWKLYDTLFHRSGIRRALGSATRVYVSPDGELSRIAFEALNDKVWSNRYLAEDYTFVYLPAARYLLWAPTKPPEPRKVQPDPGTVIFAAPDYNLKASERKVRALQLMDHPSRRDSVSVANNEPPRPVGGGTWTPLKRAIREAEDVKSVLEGSAYGPVQVYEGPDALAEVFKHVHGPRILHIATHGYFLPNPKLDQRETESVGFSGTLGWVQQSDDPLLRSGLVFAGANVVEPHDGSGAEASDDWVTDGWVTAADVAFMDLTGTDLVVLSACETGLGDVKTGDVVQGLQQSFLTVGARSLVMTLYDVPDNEAEQLMRSFYGSLAAGDDKASALHKAELSMIATRRKEFGAAHPYFWASFVLIGQPAIQ